MKYFLDTEFIESGPRMPIQLISIGIVAEDGREYYAISSEFNAADASEWVQANVINHLESEDAVPSKAIGQIAEEIRAFVGDDKAIEFWGYYADYDWVVFAQIFGTMMDLPTGFPMYCRDLKQWCDQLGNPKLPEQSSTEHNALNDARHNYAMFRFLEGMSAGAQVAPDSTL